ncbi:hypothetical protein BVY03_02650 [bacterium K02(2017)]|nr:hypothetical protein BVY03_02650 [bacterium K02(2017)]
MDATTDKIFELSEEIVSDEGCELLDVDIIKECGEQIVRLYIDKAGESGVELADCSRVSHAIEDILEVEEVLSGKYNLEVSSPGIERPLRLVKHFEAVIGQQVKVVTKEKVNGRKNYKGILQKVDQDELIIEIDEENFKVPYLMLAKAKLVISSKKESR